MLELFTDDMRRDPFPLYEQMRTVCPVLHAPPPLDVCLVFDYEGVRRVLHDQDDFSNAVPAPRNWFAFSDPPRHTKLRGLISQAFTPRVIANLEPRIRELSRELLDQAAGRHEMDLAADYSAPLPMKVIAGLLGIPPSDWQRFRRWSDTILKLSYTLPGMEGDESDQALNDFTAVTAEMNDYLTDMIAQRRTEPKDDLLTRLMEAVVDGERLSQEEILGFFQLLLVAGQETTTNLINNAIVCLLDHPDQLALLRRRPELLPSAIEETLRFRSPLQWMMRTPKREVELHGQAIAPGKLILAMIGSANRDPRIFSDADRFDITREPNPHLAFGLGLHFCLGAPLARLEARIALTDLLQRFRNIEYAGDGPWEPRKALHVHGPSAYPIRFPLA